MSYAEYLLRRRHSYRETYKAFMAVYPLTIEDLDGEIWRNVYGNYFVSTFGRVKSLNRVANYKNGKPVILKPQLLDFSIVFELFGGVDGRKRHLASRLVAQAFIPNPENKPEVNHIDGNRFNNHVSNLEWVTKSENIQHALRTGLKKSGEDNRLASLTNEQVRWLRTVYKPYDKKFGAKPLAMELGTSEQVIRLAVTGKHYKFA